MNGAEVTEDHIRAARRAYYGAISYVDDHISRLIGVLRDTGRLDRTVIIVTSDHGEMLGERGAWYKMSFYEGSARVPLIVRAPRLFGPGRVAAPVSTMDLLPTLAGLAHAGSPPGIVGPLDGRSLLPHLSGAPDRDEVVAEYLAEGAIAPIVMIRRGTLQVHPLTGRPRPALRPGIRPARAGQPGGRSGVGRARRRLPAGGRRPLGPGGAGPRGPPEPAAAAGRRPGARHRRADPVGFLPALRRGPPLHPQPHGPR